MNTLFQVHESMDQISESIRMSSYRPELLFSKTPPSSLPPPLIPRHRYPYVLLGLWVVTGKQNSHQNRSSANDHSPHLSTATPCLHFLLSRCNFSDHLDAEWLVLAKSSKRKVWLVETRRHFEDFACSVLPVLIIVINVCFA